MSENIGYMLLFLLGVVIVSFSQILLKKSAGIAYPNRLREYLNLYVVSGYAIAFLSNFLTMLAYRRISLSLGAILMALEYIFVAVLSRLFFREKLGRRKLAGLVLIILGAVIFAL